MQSTLRAIGVSALVALLLPTPARAQATRIIASGTLPATCTVGNIYLKTGASAGFYMCITVNTWSGPLTTGGAANSEAFIVQTASGGLTAEQAIGALASGLLRGATTTGVVTSLTDSAGIFANLSDESGTGSVLGGGSPTITTPTISGAIVFPDNIRQTFNPGADAAGLNVGALAGDPGTPSNGDLWYDSTANELTARINGASVALGAAGGGSGGDRTIGFTIGNGTDVFSTGIKDVVTAYFAGTITGARLLSSDASTTACSVVLDVWKDTYANYPPTNADSITASAPPTLSAATKSEDTTLTGWTTSVSIGDVLRFNVDSVTSCTKVILQLRVEE